MFSSMLRPIMSIVFQCHKSRTIEMEALDCKELKSEMINDKKLEVLWSTKPSMKGTMHASRQKVFK